MSEPFEKKQDIMYSTTLQVGFPVMQQMTDWLTRHISKISVT
jgi:hypothetical protein